MRTFQPLIILCLIAIAPAQLFAQERNADRRSAELALSDETAQLRYETPAGIGGSDSRAQYSIFLSEERDVVGSAALLLRSNLQLGPFDISFGPQAYAALLNEENEDVFAVAFGIEGRFNLVRSRGIAIVGSAFYSPDILTFGSSDKLTDFMARAEIQLTDRLIAFGGYRWFELDLLMRQERRLQNELFAGVRYELP